MVGELFTYTTIATAATAAPVYKIRQPLSKLFSVPYIGWIITLAYGFGMSWVLLNLFSMQSSIAGLANMLASLLFAVWLYFQR
jgi:hypothetical protein